MPESLRFMNPREVMREFSFYRMNEQDVGLSGLTPGEAGFRDNSNPDYNWVGISNDPTYGDALGKAMGIETPQYGVNYVKWSDLTPQQQKAFNDEMERRNKIFDATHRRQVLQGLTKVAGLMALGGVAGAAMGAGGAAGGGAAAGAGGGTGTGVGGTLGGTVSGGAATGAGVGAGVGGTADLGLTSGAVGAGVGGAGGAGVGAGVGGSAVGAGLGGSAASAGGASTLSSVLKYAKDAKKIYDAYGAYKAAQERQAAADFYGKPQTKTTTSLPYGNEYISALIKYILQNAQNVFQQRMQTYGMKATDYAPYAAMLQGVPAGYKGV